MLILMLKGFINVRQKTGARYSYRLAGPCWRVMETGHPSTRAVNSGRQLG